jgi:hypothetical protein
MPAVQRRQMYKDAELELRSYQKTVYKNTDEMKVNDSLLVLLKSDMVKNLQFPHRPGLHSATSQDKPKAACTSLLISGDG